MGWFALRPKFLRAFVSTQCAAFFHFYQRLINHPDKRCHKPLISALYGCLWGIFHVCLPTLYQLQALTNPRIQTEVGNLSLIRLSEIPFGIPGCSYATSPFTHVNPQGSRFSDGQFGMLYLADTVNTAITEVSFHQQRYWSGVHGLDYERLVFRGPVMLPIRRLSLL